MAPAAFCAPKPAEAPIEFAFPFDAGTEAICTHSSGTGSHSASNAFFALDLATDYAQPAVTVHAAADGTAYVLQGEDGSLCPQPSGAPARAETSECGDSWGNRVLILHQDGYASFYVHLERPLVKNGAKVRKGDPIGVEGWTGAAGHRHLHWSVQKIPGADTSEWVTHIEQRWSGNSVPFHFMASQNGHALRVEAADLHCAHAGIGQAPSEQQPRFRGVR